MDNKETELVNAKIHKVFIGLEDHGIMTATVDLNFGGSSFQSYGGFQLTGDNALYTFVSGVLFAVGESSWDKLVGKNCRVEKEKGWNGRIVAIQNILTDEKFNASEAFKNLK